MIYIATADHFFYHGLTSLLYPHETKRLNIMATYPEASIENVMNGDVLVIDFTPDSIPLLWWLKEKGLVPRVVLVNIDGVLPDGLLLKSYELFHRKIPVMNARDIILFGGLEDREGRKESGSLSPREAFVLNLSINSISVRKIACLLCIDIKTAYALRQRACRKLGVKRICEVALYKHMVIMKTMETEMGNELRDHMIFQIQ